MARVPALRYEALNIDNDRGKSWGKLLEIVMTGEYVRGLDDTVYINAMGFLAAIKAGNEINYEWASCPSCGDLLPYDVRH